MHEITTVEARNRLMAKWQAHGKGLSRTCMGDDMDVVAKEGDIADGGLKTGVRAGPVAAEL